MPFLTGRTPQPTATIRVSALDFKRLMLGLTEASTLVSSGALGLDGDLGALAQLGGLFDQFERRYPIMTPRPEWR